MYCQKCNRLLFEDNYICPKCGFDNKIRISKKKPLEYTPKKHKNTKFITLIIFLCILVVGLTIVLINVEKKNKKTVIPETITSNVDLKNTFNYKDLTINYPDNWGSSAGTIFYKDYAKINITFRSILENEYTVLIDNNECLPSTLNKIKTQTFASTNSYSHIINNEDTYYIITVNYTDNDKVFTNEVKLEIDKILSSLDIKK